jgi:hypothetical protein
MPIIQTTISGRDASGFVFSNVMHFQCDVGAGTFYQLLQFVNNEVNTNVIPKYSLAANDQVMFLNIASKGVGADASYTFNTNIVFPGARAIDPQLGAVSPLIRFLPDAGTILGGLYAVGAGILDFIADEIQAAYQTLLQDLANQLTGYNGSVAPHHLQLVTYNPHGPVVTPMKHNIVPTRPTTLNKRMRA